MAVASTVATALLGLTPSVQAAVLIACMVVGWGSLYAWLKSGRSNGSRDPMLIFPQVMFGIFIVALAYALVDTAREVALEWLGLIIAFDLWRLRRRQMFQAAAAAVALPPLAVLVASGLEPGHFRLGDQLVFLALSSVLVPAVLGASFTAKLVRRRQIENKEAIARALEQMRRLSLHDGLTDLYNRRHAQERLDRELQRRERAGRRRPAHVADRPPFKRINDQRGHAMGDAVLGDFGALCLQVFSPTGTDTAARWGGEEFLILMPEIGLAQAHARLMHLQHLVRHHDWQRHHPALRVSFSAGLVEHSDEPTAETLVDKADQALYRAKAQGRDRIECQRPLSDAELALAQATIDGAGSAPGVARPGEPCGTIPATPPVPSPLMPTGAAPRSVTGNRPPVAARPRAAWLLGREPRMREAVAMCLSSAAIYLSVFLAELLHGIPHGLISQSASRMLLPMQLIGDLLPYAIARSGLSARLKDPSLTFYQLMWSALVVVTAYFWITQARAYDLQLLCALMIFGFITLTPVQPIILAIWAISLLCLAYAHLAATAPTGFDAPHEGVGVAVTVFILALLALQSRAFARARQRLRLERRTLASTAERVEQLMIHDALTGLHNRQHMQGLVEHECARHERSGHGFCVALIDLDHFKRVNDLRGHAVGDEVLVRFAQTARAQLREIDALARWGGEEFLVLLPDTVPLPDGQQAMERLRTRIATSALSTSVPQLRVTASIGLAAHCPGESVAHVLERADRALYAAKHGGRDRCVVDESFLPQASSDAAPVKVA
jgi:diguanylate cyclase (GGDEF)-like protein